MQPQHDRELTRSEIAADMRRLANLFDEFGDDMPLNRDRVQVRYCVIDKDPVQAEGHFRHLNTVLARIAADTTDSRIGSHTSHAEHYDDGVTHYTSTLTMGYGRVSYQVLWIDKADADKAEEDNEDA